MAQTEEHPGFSSVLILKKTLQHIEASNTSYSHYHGKRASGPCELWPELHSTWFRLSNDWLTSGQWRICSPAQPCFFPHYNVNTDRPRSILVTIKIIFQDFTSQTLPQCLKKKKKSKLLLKSLSAWKQSGDPGSTQVKGTCHFSTPIPFSFKFPHIKSVSQKCWENPFKIKATYLM